MQEIAHAVLVSPVPDGPAYAGLDVEASLNDCCVVLRLLLEAFGIVRKALEFDIKFRVGHLRHTRRDKLVHDGLEIILGGHASDNEVSLQTHAVDALSCVFHQLDELDSLLLLRVGCLNVVVVVV